MSLALGGLSRGARALKGKACVSRPAKSAKMPQGLKMAAQRVLTGQKSYSASYTFTHIGQRYRLVQSPNALERRSYFTSRNLRNAETEQQEKTNESEKKYRGPEEPAFAPKEALVRPEWPPFGRFPYAWIGLTVASIFLFGYTWFIMREEKMIERYEFVKWGGEMDRIHSLKKLRKYLVYDSFGIIVSERMSNFGIAEVVLAATNDTCPQVRDLALEVFSGFTANERLRSYLIEELKAVDGLRKFADCKNLYVWHAVGNLAENNPEVCRQIAKDDYYMNSLLDMYERSLGLNDMYFLRPLIRLLATLASDRESALELSTTYRERLDNLMSVFIIPEAQSMVNNINLRFRLSSHCPEHWPELQRELASSGIDKEEKSNIEFYAMIHQSMVVGATGLAWSLFRAWRLSGKFEPMSRTERAWVRKAVWTSPIAAILLSHTWLGVEKVSEYVSHQLKWDGFREARYAYAPYFTLLPIYWVALNFIGPFATIPSLFRIRYRETTPPYTYHLREPILDIMEDAGFIENRHLDPTQEDRFTTNLGEIALTNQIIRQKLKEDAEWVERKNSKWFGIF